ncbi:hypothetical protein GCM10011581_17660 [Saccharopolyspora subtropica]|uniref:Uncharacterized protein n=1 Tax=Saccharopolyspora thermophila TaxID=89367 RepID=A0A917JQ16_9PSEU|nr:hypothetical protein [Saccharopolyspora subtropica]GGI80783.1 hypothetical protein GCM10011581_17660 [Saccharopolyspora subtropica]
MRSWFTWGLALSVVVLLAAVGGGVLLAREVYSVPPVEQPQSQAQSIRSPLGITYSADAAAHPDFAQIDLLLGNHFNSINTKSYDLWKSTVVPSKWDELPEQRWRQSYGSTEDRQMMVHRIERGPDDSLLVMLTFMSTQDKSQAPPQLRETCIVWNVVYPVVVYDRTLRLDTDKLPNSALLDRCRQ